MTNTLATQLMSVMLVVTVIQLDISSKWVEVKGMEEMMGTTIVMPIWETTFGALNMTHGKVIYNLGQLKFCGFILSKFSIPKS